MKSKGTAYLLWFLSIFGWLGLHRFYIGKKSTGILWIITGGMAGMGALSDLFTLGSQIEEYNYINLTEAYDTDYSDREIVKKLMNDRLKPGMHYLPSTFKINYKPHTNINRFPISHKK